MTAPLDAVARDLEAWCGIAPPRWRLADRVEERRAALGLPLERYAEAIAAEPGERAALFELLRVPHSGFFRDPEGLAALEAGLRGKAAPRVWCAGCARGEEAYSLALLAPQASVLGTDLSADAIEAGRAARFSDQELEAVPPLVRARATLEDARARVRLEVRNLLDPPPGRFDAVVCRNVLYHLSPAARRRALERLAGALAPGAPLWLGERVTLPSLVRERPGWYRSGP